MRIVFNCIQRNADATLDRVILYNKSVPVAILNRKFVYDYKMRFNAIKNFHCEYVISDCSKFDFQARTMFIHMDRIRIMFNNVQSVMQHI